MPNTIDYRVLRRRYEATHGRPCRLTSKEITQLWLSTRGTCGAGRTRRGRNVSREVLERRASATLALMRAADSTPPRGVGA